jgi:DNA-binding TFAR19-related protein (PDSD5 family)
VAPALSKPFIGEESGGAENLEEDSELKLIEQRKLAEMKRRISATTAATQKAPKEEKTPRQVVEEMLYDRGAEVLDAAYAYFPEQTPKIVEELAEMIKGGKLAEKISGGELYKVLREIGLRFNLKTSIKVQDRGKLVDLSEKLKRKEEG